MWDKVFIITLKEMTDNGSNDFYDYRFWNRGYVTSVVLDSVWRIIKLSKELSNKNSGDYDELLTALEARIEEGVKDATRAVVKSQMATYWDIGRYIVEFEQGGESHAEYGMELLKKLAKDLTLKMGRGYSRPNLYNMRRFYLTYPNGYDDLEGLTWSHVCELISIDDELERDFYKSECLAEKWDVRTLKRQKKSALYLRIASSKDKEGILSLSKEGVTIEKPEDVIKDVYTLEFLNVKDTETIDESELQTRIMRTLESFLLELGLGFTFVKEQYPIRIDNSTFHCDLVFYHRILKCFVLIDLKIDELEHKDIGQMNMYMGYFAEEINEPDDNPPVGIILVREKDELLVKYATYGMDNNLFVSKYELYLPDKEQLRKLVDNIIEESSDDSTKED